MSVLLNESLNTKHNIIFNRHLFKRFQIGFFIDVAIMVEEKLNVFVNGATSFSHNLEMKLTKEHFRTYIFIEQRRGLSAGQIIRQLQEANCENSPSESTVHRWCSKFKEGRSSLADDSISGRPNTVTTEDQIEAVKQG